MKHINKFNESNVDEYLMILSMESSDEIHINIIDYKYYSDINNFLNIARPNQKQVDDLLEIVYPNIVEHIMVQSGCVEDYSKISKYNIIKCLHLAELGQ